MTARAFSMSLIGFLIALMTACTWISNDLYESSYDYHRKGKKALAQGNYPEAQEYLEKALQDWPPELSHCPDLAAVHNNLGWAFEAQRIHNKAVDNFNSGRPLFRKDINCTHRFLAILLNNLCNSSMNQKNWKDAKEVCFVAFWANTQRPAEKVLPDAPPEDMAWGLFNWGVASAKTDSSASSYERIAGILDSDRTNLTLAKISDVYFQIGRLSLQRGDYQDSMQFHQRAQSIRDVAIGCRLESRIESLAAVGQVNLCQGFISSAADYEDRALRLRQTFLESGHPDIAKSYIGIGLVLEAQEKYPEALSSYWQALHASVAALAVSTSDSSREALQRCAGDTDADSPEQAFMALEKCRSTLETQKRLAALSLHGIGRVLSTYNPNAPAEQFDTLALSVRTATLGSNHPLTVQSHLAVGRAFEARQNFAEAENSYRSALKMAETSLGPDQQVTGVASYNVGRVLRLQGQAEEAERFINNAKSILQAALPPGDTINDQYVNNLQRQTERAYSIDELQGPEMRATIAWDSPRLPRHHQTFREFLKKKGNEFIDTFTPGQERYLENLVDDPIDDLKHEVQGMKLFGYRVYLPKFLMEGAGDPCK